MIPFFVFNDISSLDMGIVVNKLPSLSKAERDYDEIEIPGRNGKVFIDNNSYKILDFKITCTLMPRSNIRAISNWLNGPGKLVLSTEADKYYDVLIKKKIDYEQEYRICNSFSVPFQIQPIAHGLEEKYISITEETELTITESTYNIKPYIKVTGSGMATLTINNRNVILKDIDEYIELNCELEDAYKENINCNDKVLCENFPELVPGINNISWIGDISLVEIKYREEFV